MIIDENAINSFILDFVLIDKNFSVRELLEVDPKTREMLDSLNTDVLGLLMPQLVEEYGANKNIDLMVSLSHALISEKLDSSKVSGF